MGNDKNFDEIVRNFILQDRGHFITVSKDNAFSKTFRSAVQKLLALPQDCLESFTEKGPAQRQIGAAVKEGRKPLMLIERELDGVHSAEFIGYLRNDYPDLRIIVLTTEIERDGLVLLHEMGVSNFITKPISVNGMIEKIAFTIKPPSKIGELLDAGKRFLAQREFEKALVISDKVLEYKAQSPAGLMLRGDALKGLDRRSEALAAYEGAMRGGNLYLEPIKKLAQFHKEDGNHSAVLNLLEQLDKLSPLNIERKMEIGGIHLQQGKAARAKTYFDTATKLATRQAMAKVSNLYRNIASLCMESAPELAEVYLRQSLESRHDVLDASDLETFNSLGIALRQQNKWEEAIKEYKKALKIAPEDENLHYNVAMAYVDGKSYEKAASWLDKALRINGNLGGTSAAVCFNMGFIYYHAGRKQKALDRLTRALQIEPTYQRAKELIEKCQE
ncbi:response regulator receiver protein [Desulfovibrio sp. X2]|uniref:response regulator n=1 Tax=Desulfovibrio sp. X2 TaxID=941449 RepID=UPI000358CC4B|nr:response regulator [Desulfovibrio sp. X2]EPR43854.1 response regulator receiver protein [Desulfovibrio sp. X2]